MYKMVKDEGESMLTTSPHTSGTIGGSRRYPFVDGGDGRTTTNNLERTEYTLILRDNRP